ncbi:MAG TPA: potassium channel family protein [Saprospiraceae bacterium]|nr:potassium channel family protein [Saprospiraceae bacterium]
MEKETLSGLTIGIKGIFKFFSSIDILKVIIEKAWKIPKPDDIENLDFKKSKSNRVDFIVFLKVICSVTAFWLYSIYSDKTNGICENAWGVLIVVILTINLSTLSNIPLAIMDIGNRPKALSYIRASILGVLNYFELVFSFALYYNVTNSLKYTSTENIGKTVSSIDYIYYSFVTVSTIGLSNLEVVGDIGKILVMCQAFIFLIFVMIFMSYNISRINN